jgi:hypothetical protein
MSGRIGTRAGMSLVVRPCYVCVAGRGGRVGAWVEGGGVRGVRPPAALPRAVVDRQRVEEELPEDAAPARACEGGP